MSVTWMTQSGESQSRCHTTKRPAAATTFDQAGRAEIYQEYAVLQSNDLPVLYAWADIAREGLQSTVDTEAGFQDDTPTWFRQVEKLVNR